VSEIRIRPLGDWVVVEVPPKKQKMLGSIILVEHHPNQILVGTVKAVGPGSSHASGARIPAGVEVGERVAFFSANFDTSAGEQLRETVDKYEEGLGMIRSKDILFALAPGVELDLE
jgi:co-chaperonin GroES (HSP10)